MLRDELNGGSFEGPFLGTSNTYSAMTAGLVPMGTAAHELPMIIAGMLDTGDADPAWLRRAQRQVIDDWWEQYGWGLSIFLPDTFGTDFFFTVVSDDDLRRWKGFRWDSGDLFGFGERVIRAYAAIDVDPREKMLVPSDALDLPLILDAQKRFAGRIRVSYGWGTGLTNDLLDNVMIDDAWYGPVSLVVKPVRANGRGLVKLSDNPAKAIGEPGDVERYKRAAGYGEHELVALKYLRLIIRCPVLASGPAGRDSGRLPALNWHVTMLHLPILRHGVPYTSLDVIRVPHHRTREPFVEISQANPGLIRRDLRPERQAAARAALARIPFDRLIAMCGEAAGYFLNDTLPLGDAEQSPQDYVLQLTATTGMPHALVRKNMQRVASVMREMRTILHGLTRGLDTTAGCTRRGTGSDARPSRVSAPGDVRRLHVSAADRRLL